MNGQNTQRAEMHFSLSIGSLSRFFFSHFLLLSFLFSFFSSLPTHLQFIKGEDHKHIALFSEDKNEENEKRRKTKKNGGEAPKKQ